jgi:hypothetical protein
MTFSVAQANALAVRGEVASRSLRTTMFGSARDLAHPKVDHASPIDQQ